MKQYMLSVHYVDGQPAPSQEVMEQMYHDVEAVNGQLREAGAWVFAGGLHPASTATVVRMRDGEVLTTDGPFAETKEQLGGYYVADCKDLDEAIAVAAKIPGARLGSIEVRPIWEM